MYKTRVERLRIFDVLRKKNKSREKMINLFTISSYSGEKNKMRMNLYRDFVHHSEFELNKTHIKAAA